ARESGSVRILRPACVRESMVDTTPFGLRSPPGASAGTCPCWGGPAVDQGRGTGMTRRTGNGVVPQAGPAAPDPYPANRMLRAALLRPSRPSAPCAGRNSPSGADFVPADGGRLLPA